MASLLEIPATQNPTKPRRGRGEGSVYQRESDGLWVATLDLGYVNGKRKRRALYGKTKREALAKFRAAQAKQAQGLPLPAERETVGSFLSRWLDDIARPTLAPRSYESYAMIVSRHLVPALGRIKLARLTPQQVQRYLNDKQAEGLAARTVAYHRAVLRKALNDALRWSLVGRNVAALASPPKQEKARKRYLTPDEAKQLLDAIAGHRLEPLVITALGLGLRQGEVLGLRWQDIDDAAGVVRPQVQAQRIKGEGLVLRPLKSAGSAAPLPLPEIVAGVLRSQRTRVLEMRLAAGPAWTDHDLVFPSAVGTPQDPRNLSRAWDALRGDIGMAWLGFHGLRHGFGSLLAARGVHPRTAMEMMRHSQFSLTMEIYTHVAPEVAREAAREIDRALGS